MNFLMDSGFLYATFDINDDYHQRVNDVLASLSDEIIMLPTVVLVEVSYLLTARIGYHAAVAFASQMKDSPLVFEYIQKNDMIRIHELQQQYANIGLDFVDASIIALAERLDIRNILTVDRRDFRIVRPHHCDYLNILP